MNVTQVSIGPTQASLAQQRPTLVPEMLAAVGARYSRSNLGLEAILDKISGQDQEQSIDAIFRFIDFGHASVADMVPVALFMDGISMWLAYHIWSLCPLAGGQESSTRYLKLSADNLPNAHAIGIPAEQRDEWRAAMESALDAYERALTFWESVAETNPGVTRIPASLLADQSDKAQKQVARMKRNYAFDRARYFLPAALLTNVMMVQSARAWVGLCQQLLSHPLPEPQQLGAAIRDELALVAPRLIKHAAAQQSLVSANADSWKQLHDLAAECGEMLSEKWENAHNNSQPTLEVWTKPEESRFFADDLQFHDNRYATIGPQLQMTPVRFGWGRVAFGDIRDLNRHRTGSKRCFLMPWGFYGATDQTENPEYSSIAQAGAQLNYRAYEQLLKPEPTYLYWILLGSQFAFQHTTTADKFIYEAELRTGVGAHYRYAQHLHDVLELWYQKFPATRGLILEGSAEPE